MKPDWSLAPLWAEFTAMDADGDWWWYASQPRFDPRSGNWFVMGGLSEPVLEGDMASASTILAKFAKPSASANQLDGMCKPHLFRAGVWWCQAWIYPSSGKRYKRLKCGASPQQAYKRCVVNWHRKRAHP